MIPSGKYQKGHEFVYAADELHSSFCTLLAKTAEGLCSILSPSVIQWDAMTVFMECMATQIFKSLEEEVTFSTTDQNCESKYCRLYSCEGFPPSSALYCVEAAHRSEHGAVTGCAELRHQRPAPLVLCAHQRLCPLPFCHT